VRACLRSIALLSLAVAAALTAAAPATSSDGRVRAGVASGAGTISWIGFLPFALTFGWVTKQYGVHASGWMMTAATIVVSGLLVRMSQRQQTQTAAAAIPTSTSIPAAAGC